MCRTGSPDRLHEQRFTLTSCRLGYGTWTKQGGSVQCLLQRGGQPASMISLCGSSKEENTAEKHEAAGHRAPSRLGIERKAPGGARAPEKEALGLGRMFVLGEKLISPSDKLD